MRPSNEGANVVDVLAVRDFADLAAWRAQHTDHSIKNRAIGSIMRGKSPRLPSSSPRLETTR